MSLRSVPRSYLQIFHTQQQCDHQCRQEKAMLREVAPGNLLQVADGLLLLAVDVLDGRRQRFRIFRLVGVEGRLQRFEVLIQFDFGRQRSVLGRFVVGIENTQAPWLAQNNPVQRDMHVVQPIAHFLLYVVADAAGTVRKQNDGA
ncbi:conserved hypothetical protein [Ricinus communis]|uniref:Uncharacterized protein n=1 Tax=Ricinus communis TaxID=3988 RepID=B9TN69_RICCO|nr:conserved hypothetical protein [Ricinus communis]